MSSDPPVPGLHRWKFMTGYEWLEPMTEFYLCADVDPLLARLREWQPIETAPKDGTLIIGALIRNGRVWRVHEMRHNTLAFYTTNGGTLPRMTHWMEMPALPATKEP